MPRKTLERTERIGPETRLEIEELLQKDQGRRQNQRGVRHQGFGSIIDQSESIVEEEGEELGPNRIGNYFSECKYTITKR